jgi:hypothetical protein
MTHWPCREVVAGCDPHAVACLAIMSGCGEAPYNDAPDFGGTPTKKDREFWQRVATERERIARWVVNSLAITGRAE